jgi:hypothetical protein
MSGLVKESTFFANKGTITVAGASGSPSVVTLAVVKDVEIVMSAEHVPLYGWGSVKRVAVAKHSAKVSVKIGFAKFSPAVSGSGASPWFPFWILNATAGTGTLSDSNTVKTFTVTANFISEDGENLLATIANVYFPNFPLKMTEGTWMRVDLDGEGSDITFTNP